MVEGYPFSFVFSVPVDLEQSLDFVKERLFSSIIGCSEVLRALEHEVLEIMGEACRL